MSAFQREMRWQCGTPGCQTEMLGRYKKCSKCGKPKEKEKFYSAPGPATSADAVTDPALLKQAEAGKDWHCFYCGYAERRDSGECLSCGAPSKDSLPPTTRTSPPTLRAIAVGTSERARFYRREYLPWVAWFAGVVFIALLLWFVFSSKEVEARVAARQWTHSVHVERYQTVPEEGFREDTPSDAFDVTPEGRRVHHHDRVPDGYRSESYEESYTCGETCTTTPVRCVSNDNGFETCSGGDRSCSPKYCSRTKTRQVRQYRDEPVYQSWYRWKVWRWHYHRTVTESGSGEKVRSPSEEKVALNRNLGPGEKERFGDAAEYVVVFSDAEGDQHKYSPKTLAEYQDLDEGQTRRLEVSLAGVSILQEAP